MKKLFTGMGALLLSVMCLGVVSSANNDDISTQAIEGGGGEPCTIVGSKSYTTSTRTGTSFTVKAKSPGSVSAAGINVTINNGSIKANSGAVNLLNANTAYKTFNHTGTTTEVRYIFTPAKQMAGYVVNYTFTVRY